MGVRPGTRIGEARGGAVRAVTAAAVLSVLLVACDGDGTGEVTETAAADAAVEEEPATESVDDAQATEEAADDPEPIGDAEADAGDGPVDLASAQAELDPWATFDTPPLDVELPDAPGQAILQLGDQRIEMATGQCRGGPVYPIDDTPLEDVRARQGVFRFEGGASEVDGDLGVLWLLTEGVTAEGIEGEVMIRRAYQLNIAVPDLPMPTAVWYQEFPGGRVNEGLEAPNTSFADVPNLAVTRDGLVTAQGTLERSASEFVDPPVEVAFAARCPEEWVAAIDELEAEHR